MLHVGMVETTMLQKSIPHARSPCIAAFCLIELDPHTPDMANEFQGERVNDISSRIHAMVRFEDSTCV
jgi:hypothetical protein